MPLPSIRRASRRLGVASLIHPPRGRLSGPIGAVGGRRPRGRPEAIAGPRPGRVARTALERYQRRELSVKVTHRRLFTCKYAVFPAAFGARGRHAGATGPDMAALGTISPLRDARRRRRSALSSADPNYDPSTDTYRQIYRGPRQRLRGHQRRGPDGLLRPRHQRGPRLRRSPTSAAYYEAHKTAGRRVRGQPAGQGAGEPRGGDGLRRRGDPLRRAHRRVLLGAPPEEGPRR